MAGSARRLPDSGDLASGCLLGGARALFHVLGGVALLVLSFGNAELRPFYLIYWAVFMALLALGSLPSIFRSWTDEIAIVIGLLAGVVVPARTAQIGFYEASAQIIPVLLLALAIELRPVGCRRRIAEGPGKWQCSERIPSGGCRRPDDGGCLTDPAGDVRFSRRRLRCRRQCSRTAGTSWRQFGRGLLSHPRMKR
jgi:hypothetical protein